MYESPILRRIAAAQNTYRLLKRMDSSAVGYGPDTLFDSGQWHGPLTEHGERLSVKAWNAAIAQAVVS
jgi:hypothetical protein